MYYRHIGPVKLKLWDVWIWEGNIVVDKVLYIRAWEEHGAIGQAQSRSRRVPGVATVYEVRPAEQSHKGTVLAL